MTSLEGGCRLYLITPPRIDLPEFAQSLTRALDAGDVAAVQLRLKGCSDDVVRDAIKVLQPIAQDRGVAFVLNDRPDLAAEMGCDGVHIGQSDAPYTEARKLLGEDRIVGVTCHASRHLAIEAAEAGADYVAFGAFFPSTTKPEADEQAPADLLVWWSEIAEVPCVAIGGITPRNCSSLVSAGADFLAVASAIWGHPQGPAFAMRDFASAIAAAKPIS
ncbi:MAG: thiamine phosphate synthase [Alphaproteobacteria bacterium]